MDANNSPEIETISYEEETQNLWVKYRDSGERPGWLLLYSGVPRHLYEGLQKAASPVDYLKMEIEAAGYRGAGSLSLKGLRPAPADLDRSKVQELMAKYLEENGEESDDWSDEDAQRYTIVECGVASMNALSQHVIRDGGHPQEVPLPPLPFLSV